MSDVYVTDTTKALEEADSVFASILTEWQDDYSEKWNNLYNEVDSLLDKYKELLEERDELLVKVEELEEKE